MNRRLEERVWPDRRADWTSRGSFEGHCQAWTKEASEALAWAPENLVIYLSNISVHF